MFKQGNATEKEILTDIGVCYYVREMKPKRSYVSLLLQGVDGVEDNNKI
jgi:hypothetical protein